MAFPKIDLGFLEVYGPVVSVNFLGTEPLLQPYLRRADPDFSSRLFCLARFDIDQTLVTGETWFDAAGNR